MFKKLVLSLILVSTAAWPITVFDGANFVQNSLNAVRTLQSNVNEVRGVMNQVEQIQNQLQQLENDAKNLKKLDFDSIGQLESLLFDTNFALARSSKAFADVEQIGQEYQRHFGGYNDLQRFEPTDNYYANVNDRLKLSHQASQDAIESIAVLKTNQADMERTNELVVESQMAEGQLAAIQAQTQIQGQMIHEFKKLELLTAQGVKQHSVALADENMNKALGHKKKEQFWGSFAERETTE
jgi:P-type conjugative transfer protein TrbJ